MSSSGGPNNRKSRRWKPRILFSGTYCSLNKGDAAMQLGAYRSLKAVIPEAEISILTSFPEIDQQTYNGFRLCKSSRRQPVGSLILLIRVMLWWVVKTCCKVDLSGLLSSRELREYRRADALVDLSGDTLTEDYGIKCFLSHLVPILIGLFLKRPVVLCAQTIGPFGITLPLARLALNRVTLITTREELSFTYLQSVGIVKPPLHRTADVAFLLDPAEPQRVNEILAAEGVSEADGPLVGITISRLLGHRYAPNDPKQFEGLMAAVVDYLIERMAVTVAMVSHVLGPGEERDDRLMATSIYRQVKNKARTRVLGGDYRPEELKGVIGRFQLFLGLRMHANIAALSMGVPTLAIAYSRKTPGIMRTVGQERWVCDIATVTLEELTKKIEALWRQRGKVCDDLQSRMVAIKQKATENAVLVRRLLETPCIDHRLSPGKKE